MKGCEYGPWCLASANRLGITLKEIVTEIITTRLVLLKFNSNLNLKKNQKFSNFTHGPFKIFKFFKSMEKYHM
jgi:hypothetical protein